MEKRLQGSESMICLICRQATLLDGQTSVNFGRGEISFIVNRVPAWTCPQCGEAFLDEDIAQQLLQEAEKVSRAGIRHLAYDYGHLPENGMSE
jgi:YgiT-type zinc finger domain-containing protein